MKNILFILLISFSIVACDKDDDSSSGNGTPVFKNQADSLEGVYMVNYKRGATAYPFITEITSSKVVENEFYFSKLNPYDTLIKARLEASNVKIDSVYDSSRSSCGQFTEYYYYFGSGTIQDSIMDIRMTRWFPSNSGFGYDDYSINLNQ